MTWIDEMFVSMEKDKADASAKRSAKGARSEGTEHRKKQIPGALNAWKTLVSSIAKDVNDFNKHKKRAGQTPACLFQRHDQCEVYLPGMHGKRLVLTLDDNDLHVTVHPDFPEQQLTITVQPDKEGQHTFWVLGDPAKESAKLTAQQLSEYLLKPALACGDINGEP
jgi:hypothetical protein